MPPNVPSVAGTSWEAATLGTGTGLLGGVSKPPWDLRTVVLQESVSLNARDWIEPRWRLSSVYTTRTLCQLKPKLVKTELLHRNGNGAQVTHMRATPQSPGDLPAWRSPVKPSP